MLKKLLQSKAFYVSLLIIVIGALIIGITWPLLPLALVYLFSTIGAIFSNFLLLKILAIATAIIFGFLLFLYFGIPFIIYFLRRLSIYFSLFMLCLRKKYKLKIRRFPFASLFAKIKEKEDIAVVTPETTYCIHFVDILIKFRRQLTIIENNKYCITKVVPDKLSRQGTGIFEGNVTSRYVHTLSSHSLEDGKLKDLPTFSLEDGVTHIVMAIPNPVAVNISKNNRTEKLYNGTNCGNFEYYSLKSFLTLLNN